MQAALTAVRFRLLPEVPETPPCPHCLCRSVNFIAGAGELSFTCPACLEEFDADDVRAWLAEVKACLDRLGAEQD